MPLLIAKRDGPAGLFVEPFERFDQVSEESVAAHLSVGHDVETCRLLQRDGLVHRAVLDSLEVRVRDRSGVASGAGLLQILRTEQAADDITLEQIHRTTLVIAGVVEHRRVPPAAFGQANRPTRDRVYELYLPYRAGAFPTRRGYTICLPARTSPTLCG